MEHLEASRVGHSSARSTAPVYTVPQERVVSIDHPCIVNNFNNGFKSLGGEPQLKHALEHRVGDSLLKVDGKAHVFPDPVVGVSLRPNDPLAKKLASTGLETRNVLMKITLPKRSGRKRKRGSDDPFTSPLLEEPQNDSITAPDLLRRMRDNQDAYRIEPVSTVLETHRFRSQPDFQMHTRELPVMSEITNHVSEGNYDTLKKFRVDMKSGSGAVMAFPLPLSFTPTDQPYHYQYQQTPWVVSKTDEHGNTTIANSQGYKYTAKVMSDAKGVPQGPPPTVKRGRISEETLNKAIQQLSDLLAKRPIVNRRVALSAIPGLSGPTFDKASQWVGYGFASGPWRDTLIRYGVDPRSDAKYRFYQSLAFQLDQKTFKLAARKWGQKDDDVKQDEVSNGYVFDGISIGTSGHYWQACDVTYPLLYNLLHTDDVRTQCDPVRTGWYHFTTLAKARVVMRDKFRCLLTGETPPEEDYEILVALPDAVTCGNITQAEGFDDSAYSSKVLELARECRSLSKSYLHTRQGEGNSGEGDGETGDGWGALDPRLSARGDYDKSGDEEWTASQHGDVGDD